VDPGGSGPPINTNVVSVTGNQTVALTANADQITGDAGNNEITVTGSPNTGDFVDGGGNTNVSGANGMQPGVDILNLTGDFSATGSNALGVMNIESIVMSGASSKHIMFGTYNPFPTTVRITPDGNGGDKYLVSSSDSQNQRLLFNGLASNRQTQESDLIDLGGGTGDSVFLTSGHPLGATLANVENVEIGNNAVVHLISSGGSNNLIFVNQNDTIDLTQSAGNDIITHKSGSSPSGHSVNGFNGAGDSIKFLRAQFNGDTDNNNAIDVGKLLSGANKIAAEDEDDFWIFDTTTKILRYDSDGNGGNSATVVIDFDSTSTVDGSNIANVIQLISSQVTEFS
jgi:hypothetical protein